MRNSDESVARSCPNLAGGMIGRGNQPTFRYSMMHSTLTNQHHDLRSDKAKRSQPICVHRCERSSRFSIRPPRFLSCEIPSSTRRRMAFLYRHSDNPDSHECRHRCALDERMRRVDDRLSSKVSKVLMEVVRQGRTPRMRRSSTVIRLERE